MSTNAIIPMAMAASIVVFGIIHPMNAYGKEADANYGTNGGGGCGKEGGCSYGHHGKAIRDTDGKTHHAGEVKAEDLLGNWYTIAMINPQLDVVQVSCDRRSVTKADKDNYINVVDSAMSGGSLLKYEGEGKVENSETHIKYRVFGDEEDVNKIESYNNGDECILHDLKNTKHYVLHSRKPTASDGTIKKFEQYATDNGLKVTYINQDNCS